MVEFTNALYACTQMQVYYTCLVYTQILWKKQQAFAWKL